MTFVYPVSMICFGIYIGTYHDCKPTIEYIHETVISLCSDPNKRKQETEPDDEDEDDMPALNPIE
jgi:hypothetical protein